MTRLERKLNKRLEEDKLRLISTLLEISYIKETNLIKRFNCEYLGLYMPEPVFEEFKSYMNPLVASVVTTDPTGLAENTSHSIQFIDKHSNYVIDTSKLMNAHTIHRMSDERDTLTTYQYIMKHYKNINETIRLGSNNLNIQIYKLMAGDNDSFTPINKEINLFQRILNLIMIEESVVSESTILNQITTYDPRILQGENINRLCRLFGLDKITFVVLDDDFFSCDKTEVNVIVSFKTNKMNYMIKTCSYHGSRVYEYKAEQVGKKTKRHGVEFTEYTPLEIELSDHIKKGTKYVEFTPYFDHLDNFKATAVTKLREAYETINSFME